MTPEELKIWLDKMEKEGCGKPMKVCHNWLRLAYQAGEQAATERAAGLMAEHCYCQDWDKEMCPYCHAEELIREGR